MLTFEKTSEACFWCVLGVFKTLYNLLSCGLNLSRWWPCPIPTLWSCNVKLPLTLPWQTHCLHLHSSCDFSFFKIQTCRGGDNFEQTGQQREVHIKFYCNPKKPRGEPTFTGQELNKYFFDVQTSLVCSAKAVQCSVKSDGKSYDLTPLGLTDGKLKWLL